HGVTARTSPASASCSPHNWLPPTSGGHAARTVEPSGLMTSGTGKPARSASERTPSLLFQRPSISNAPGPATSGPAVVIPRTDASVSQLSSSVALHFRGTWTLPGSNVRCSPVERSTTVSFTMTTPLRCTRNVSISPDVSTSISRTGAVSAPRAAVSYTRKRDPPARYTTCSRPSIIVMWTSPPLTSGTVFDDHVTSPVATSRAYIFSAPSEPLRYTTRPDRSAITGSERTSPRFAATSQRLPASNPSGTEFEEALFEEAVAGDSGRPESCSAS